MGGGVQSPHPGLFPITLFHYWVKSCSCHLLAVWLWQTLPFLTLQSGMTVPTSQRSAPRRLISSWQAVTSRGDSLGVCGVWFMFLLRIGPSVNSEEERDQSCSRKNHRAALHKTRVRTKDMVRRKGRKISDRNESW